MPQDRGIIDAASGGELDDKTPNQARILISNMAENTQQFGTRGVGFGRHLGEGSSSSMETQIANLTDMISKLVNVGVQKPRLCGICSLEGHTTEECPQLQEGNVNVVFLTQRRYDPYSGTYNEGWRDHPNFRYQQQQDPRYQPNTQASSQSQNAEGKTQMMFEALMKKMDSQKQDTNDKLQSLESAVKQLQQRATATDANVGNLQA